MVRFIESKKKAADRGRECHTCECVSGQCVYINEHWKLPLKAE